ncbi:MAG TPA: membrane protein insertase YidC [Streptosporangiaceae bacterium]|nr:membrane protein insertase YidC [Streptosporangiaceae bacterium]
MFSIPGVAVSAAYHLVSALARALAPLPGGLAAAAAIVGFTLAVRLLLLPLSYYAIRGQASQARLAPQVQALRRRHAGQPDRLQAELAALYRREGTGMFAGCLPLLLQLPFLSVMYALFRSGTVGGRPNALLGRDLLGAGLGSHWLSGPGPLSAQGAVFLGLFALLAAAAWLAARVTRRAAARLAPDGQPPVPPGGAAGLLLRAVPYASIAVAAVMPLAAGLYLLTTTAWSAAERALLAPARRRRPPPAGGARAAGCDAPPRSA